MRIVTWNCKKGLDKKTEALLSQNPDVAVISECSENSTIALREHGYETVWFGSNPIQGLGIISRKGWAIRALPQPHYEWVVPLDIAAPTPFRLIAVWACKSKNKEIGDYVGQIHHALQSHPEWFDGIPTILAGDLNSNKVWDKKRRVANHSTVVTMLQERGLVSSYHNFFNENQGQESLPTFYFHHKEHKPYHIDYIFIPQECVPHLKSVEVGTYGDWSKRSDHCPLVAELTLPSDSPSR